MTPHAKRGLLQQKRL